MSAVLCGQILAKYGKLSNMKTKKPILCSACLLGVNCRYNGKTKTNDKVLALAKTEVLIPVCPEILAGFPTPRGPVEIVKGRATQKDGQDVSKKFREGAKEVLKIAKLMNVEKAILKERSPSCGKNFVPEGTFSGKVKKGRGFTAALLAKNGIEIISEEEL